MKPFRTLFPILGIAATLAGCGGGATTGSAASANTVQAPAALTSTTDAGSGDRRAHAGHDGRSGPNFLAFAALHENLNLTPQQRTTIEGLISDDTPQARPEPDPARRTALANAIRSGKLDVAALSAPPDGVAAKMAERRAETAKDLATLHQTLTKEQRVALVDGLLAKRDGADRDRGERGSKGDADRPRREHGKRGHGHRGADRAGHGPMGGLLEGLDLTQAQREQIKSQLDAQRPSDTDREAMKAKFEAMKKERETKLLSFKEDNFDANAFVAPPPGFDKAGPAARGEHLVKDLAVIVSVLTPAQREQLAQKIEQGPKPPAPEAGER